MTLSRPRRHGAVFTFVPLLLLLLVSTLVAAQDIPASTVVLVTTELNTATTAGKTEIVTLTSTAATKTATAIPTTPTTLATIVTTDTSTSPTSYVPTNTAQPSQPNKGIPKVVIIVASLGGTAVLAAVLMGCYFCCCKPASKKKPIVSQEFFAPIAVPMREPRLPVLPPTPPVSGTPLKEQQQQGNRWPLGDARGAGPPPRGAGGYRGTNNTGEYKRDEYRGSLSPPLPGYQGGYNRGGPPPPQRQGYGGDGVDYAEYRNPDMHMWDQRDDGTGRVAELPLTGSRRIPSGSRGGGGAAEVDGTSRVPRRTAELPS
ncbi:hypothetical protein BDD12DRAFT_804950 [Trichophaea hybrida]|nr:hypothetical protein BDD12DRAFT_804950 [Trichophaea hybrida]